ncbi:MAG: aldo/keto reductase [Methylotenera sp.]|nr:aldo/keto reductase [Oligoflexia bacterium]
MEYRKLGKSGLRLSAFSFGSWVTFSNQLDLEKAKECMHFAYDQGVNFFDNAEVYAEGKSEELMGTVIRDAGWGRDTFCVSSKVFWGGEKPTQMGLSKKHVTDACHAALKRLQVDYLDLYFCHRPDQLTPIEETVRAMHALIQQGKVLYWGTSEWSAQQLTEAYAVAKENHLTPPTMEQPEYNLFNRERFEKDYLPLFQNYGMGTTIWSPLASGVLTGKYSNGFPADSRLNMPGYEWLKSRYTNEEGKQRIAKTVKLTQLAQSLDMTSAQLALAWCLKNPNVSTVILGASKVQQLSENMRALEKVTALTPDVMNQIEVIVANRPEAIPDFM